MSDVDGPGNEGDGACPYQWEEEDEEGSWFLGDPAPFSSDSAAPSGNMKKEKGTKPDLYQDRRGEDKTFYDVSTSPGGADGSAPRGRGIRKPVAKHSFLPRTGGAGSGAFREESLHVGSTAPRDRPTMSTGPLEWMGQATRYGRPGASLPADSHTTGGNAAPNHRMLYEQSMRQIRRYGQPTRGSAAGSGSMRTPAPTDALAYHTWASSRGSRSPVSRSSMGTPSPATGTPGPPSVNQTSTGPPLDEHSPRQDEKAFVDELQRQVYQMSPARKPTLLDLDRVLASLNKMRLCSLELGWLNVKETFASIQGVSTGTEKRWRDLHSCCTYLKCAGETTDIYSFAKMLRNKTPQSSSQG